MTLLKRQAVETWGSLPRYTYLLPSPSLIPHNNLQLNHLKRLRHILNIFYPANSLVHGLYLYSYSACPSHLHDRSQSRQVLNTRLNLRCINPTLSVSRLKRTSFPSLRSTQTTWVLILSLGPSRPLVLYSHRLQYISLHTKRLLVLTSAPALGFPASNHPRTLFAAVDFRPPACSLEVLHVQRRQCRASCEHSARQLLSSVRLR